MRRPTAATFLGRIAHMTADASLARTVDEGRLGLRVETDDERRIEARLKSLAREDRAACEEARALAVARGWPAQGGGLLPYGWTKLRGARLLATQAEILRILARDVFELDLIARDDATIDDDVIALASRVATARRAAREALIALDPKAALPGAK